MDLKKVQFCIPKQATWRLFTLLLACYLCHCSHCWCELNAGKMLSTFKQKEELAGFLLELTEIKHDVGFCKIACVKH